METNKIYHDDCIEFMGVCPENAFDLTLTDIPYGVVNRCSNGLRLLDKSKADQMTFDLEDFLNAVYRVTNGTIIVFCAREQISQIYAFFADKQEHNKGTVRQIVWEKTNPSPMNGQHIYLSGVENAVWFKKRGAAFNAHCKNTVFRHPCGTRKIHPTEKNHALLKELILDNSNENDIVFDPCAGSGSHLLVAKENNRRYVGVELYEKYYELAAERLEGGDT